MTWDRTLTTNTHTIYLASHHPRNATLPVQFIITDGKHGYNFGSYNRDSGEGKMTIKNIGIVNDEEGVCYRATFIIDPEGTIQHVSVNALDTGRNALEVLRTLQALQAGGLTGCSWTLGDEFVG